MKDKAAKYMDYIRKIGIGLSASLLIIAVLFCIRGDLGSQLLLYETMPFYNPGQSIAELFRLAPWQSSAPVQAAKPVMDVREPESQTAAQSANAKPQETVIRTDGLAIREESALDASVQIEDTFANYSGDIISTRNVVYQDEINSGDITGHFAQEAITVDRLDQLQDIVALRRNFYSVDKNTDMPPELFDVGAFMAEDLTLNTAVAGPQVLIFHTHSQEFFADSDQSNLAEGVVGLGSKLGRILEEKYGLKVLHITDQYDMDQGKFSRDGSYERMEPAIEKVIAENPSIQLAIDLHRDGVNDDVRLVTDINGKPTAKIMFFNGLSMLYNDGVLEPIASLPNPYLKTNLALSFRAQLTANALYPDLTRKIFLRGYRYSLHMLPKSMLVEVGAQTNTKEEALNAMDPLAEIIARVVLQ